MPRTDDNAGAVRYWNIGSIALIVLGLALLGWYGRHYVDSSSGHREGIEAFEKARAAAAATAAATDATGNDSAPAAPLELPASLPGELPLELPGDAPPRTETALPADNGPALPDTRNWSDERIAAYRAAESRANASEVPEGILRIPSVSLEVPVFSGTAETALSRGAGRIEGTPRLGAAGNVGIAAHRDGYFRALEDVVIGDTLAVETLSGEQQYRVTEILIVEPTDVHVLAPTAADSVTLVTCYPFYYLGAAPQRYIVRAERS